MFKAIINFLSPQKTGALSQAEREAGLALIILIMFIDDHLSDIEEKVLRRELKNFTWEGPHNEEYFVNTCMAEVRVISESPDAIKEFIVKQTSVLRAKSTTNVLQICHDMINSDGHKHEKEKEILALIKSSIIENA